MTERGYVLVGLGGGARGGRALDCAAAEPRARHAALRLVRAPLWGSHLEPCQAPTARGLAAAVQPRRAPRAPHHPTAPSAGSPKRPQAGRRSTPPSSFTAASCATGPPTGCWLRRWRRTCWWSVVTLGIRACQRYSVR